MDTQLIVKYDELLADFDLFLCEHYGYRNSTRFNHIMNGEIICADTRAYHLYIRFWEYGGATRGLPDKIVILVWASFYKGGQEKGFTNLMRFIKAYASIYGFEWICIEDKVDELDKTCYGFPKQDNDLVPYGAMRIADLILP